MRQLIGNGIVVFGLLAAAGCGGPGPTDKDGGFQLPAEAKKKQEEASKETPDQMMEKMKKGGPAGDPTKQK